MSDEKVQDLPSMQATVVDGVIVIAVPISMLNRLVGSGYLVGEIPQALKVTNNKKLSWAICREINYEDKNGSNAVHKLISSAIVACVKAGEESVEVETGWPFGSSLAPHP